MNLFYCSYLVLGRKIKKGLTNLTPLLKRHFFYYFFYYKYNFFKFKWLDYQTLMLSDRLTVPVLACLQCLHSPFTAPFSYLLNCLVILCPSCSSEAVKASPVFTRRASTVVTKSRALVAQERWLIHIQPVNQLIY